VRNPRTKNIYDIQLTEEKYFHVAWMVNTSMKRPLITLKNKKKDELITWFIAELCSCSLKTRDLESS